MGTMIQSVHWIIKTLKSKITQQILTIYLTIMVINGRSRRLSDDNDVYPMSVNSDAASPQKKQQ